MIAPFQSNYTVQMYIAHPPFEGVFAKINHINLLLNDFIKLSSNHNICTEILGHTFHPTRHIHRIANDCIFQTAIGTNISDCDFPVVNTNTIGKGNFIFRLPDLTQFR